jgi:3-hydroxybutyryl-CoA dehydrogenase
MVTINKIAVIGAGIMGNGIAQVASQAGYEVSMYDIEAKALEKGFDSIKNSLGRMTAKGKISEADAAKVVANIKGSLDLKEAVKEGDLVIECVPEVLDLKKKVFKQLDEFCPAHTILATNTSNCSITAIASATRRPQSVVGMHFANPVPVMRGVELIRGLDTTDEVTQAAKDVIAKMGKEYYVAQDYPGFCGNRGFMVFLNENFNVAMQGISTPADIDKNYRLSFGHPLGPFELADLIGLDQLLHGMEYLNQQYGDRYLPSQLLVKLVAAGYYGRKTGRGFYRYNEKGEKL